MVSAAILSDPALSLIEQPHGLSDLRSHVSAAEGPSRHEDFHSQLKENQKRACIAT
jgi:hypothetical protein